MERWAWAGALLGLLFTVPLTPVMAADAEGSFTTSGTLTFPPATRMEGAPFAVFIPDATKVGSLQATVPRVTVTKFEKDFLGMDGGLLPTVQSGETRRATWTLTDVTLTLAGEGDHGGFIGFYPAPDAILTATGAVGATPRGPGAVGDSSTTGEEPDSVFYTKRIVAPHFLLSGVATLKESGMGAMKIRGPDVTLKAAENTTTIPTGTTRNGPTDETISWLYLSFDAAATVLLQDAAFEAATADERATWDGSLHFTPTAGSLRTDEQTYSPTGRAAALTGAFTATLTPNGGHARMSLAGDLRSTTLLASARTPLPEPAGGTPLLPWLLVGAALLVGGGAAAIVVQRNRSGTAAATPTPPRDVDELADLARSIKYEDLVAAARSPAVPTSASYVRRFAEGAELAEAQIRWRDACDLIRAARIGDPKNPDFAFKHGFYLYFLGEYQFAYGAFHDATRLRPAWGEPHYWAAICMTRFDAAQVAEHHIQEALDRQPELVLELEGHEDFQALRGSPGYEEAIRQAHARLASPKELKSGG